MKKIIGKILVAVLLVGMFCGASYYEHNYTRKDCKVTDKNDAVIEFTDKCGWTWVWCAESEEDIELYQSLEVGNHIDVKMYDNFTSANIDDDEITKIIKK
jgi:hypothetical protein